MAGRVKSSRTYTSPLREAQAASTRQAVLTAARRLFEQEGYAATSMPAVAAAAGVAVKTVYLSFGTKPELLRAVWDHRLAGAEAGTPVLERQWYREVEEDASPAAKLRRLARQSGGVKARTGKLLVAIRDGASMDEAVALLWDEIEAKLHQVSRAVVEQLHQAGALRGDVSADAAADQLWAINHPSTWQLLVLGRGWSDDDYESWLERTFAAQLLQ